jgi:hypothetical protein
MFFKRRQNMKAELIRQGDVMFIPIAKLPEGERKKRENGTVAYGEATGHSHTVMSPSTVEVLDIGDETYLNVHERGEAIEADIARVEPWLRAIIEDAHESALRKTAAQQVLAKLPTAGAIFCHGTEDGRSARPVPGKEEDRHLPVAIPVGLHRIPRFGAGTQREYSPEAIRNVVD